MGRDLVGTGPCHHHAPSPQEKNARLLGAAQQLFGHCQAQKEEIKRLFQQKLDEVGVPEATPATLGLLAQKTAPSTGFGWAGAGARCRPEREIWKDLFLSGALTVYIF